MTTYQQQDLAPATGVQDPALAHGRVPAARDAARSAGREARAGWVLVEKFDNGAAWLPEAPGVGAQRDAALGFDPYRTYFGLSDGQFVALLLGLIFGGLALIGLNRLRAGGPLATVTVETARRIRSIARRRPALGLAAGRRASRCWPSRSAAASRPRLARSARHARRAPDSERCLRDVGGPTTASARRAATTRADATGHVRGYHPDGYAWPRGATSATACRWASWSRTIRGAKAIVLARRGRPDAGRPPRLLSPAAR